MNSRYQQNFKNWVATNSSDHGVSLPKYEKALEQTALAIKKIISWLELERERFLVYPSLTDDIEQYESIAQVMRARFSKIAIIGVGGASLGAQAVCALSSKAFQGAPSLIFLDNPSAERLEMELEDIAATGFIVISKSGNTAETIAQTLVVLERASPDQFLFISEPAENPLRRIADHFKIQVLDHDPKLGGRFSVFSVVGVLPALIAGIDVRRLRLGAQETIDSIVNCRDPLENYAITGAALALAMSEDISATVVMPYDDRLLPLAHWMRQLWAESLGKNGKGLTPIVARGAVDQHSQLQLYLDGPADKIFTLIRINCDDNTVQINRDFANIAGTEYLGGKSLGDLMTAEAISTRDALIEANRPIREIVLPSLDETSLGSLMMQFIIETVVMALALEIDPFNQPAVERGKELARNYLRGKKNEN